MNTIVVLENEFATTWCYPSKRLIHHEFHRFCSGDDFRNVMTKGAEAFEAHSCTKWLSGDKMIGLAPPEDVEWGRQHWTSGYQSRMEIFGNGPTGKGHWTNVSCIACG